MPKNLLEQLREVTVVVADTGDIEAIKKVKPIDATTNPSLITAAAQMPEYQGIVDDTLKAARASLGAGASADEVATLAFDKLAEGIDGFSKALVQLEDLLKGRLAALEA